MPSQCSQGTAAGGPQRSAGPQHRSQFRALLLRQSLLLKACYTLCSAASPQLPAHLRPSTSSDVPTPTRAESSTPGERHRTKLCATRPADKNNRRNPPLAGRTTRADGSPAIVGLTRTSSPGRTEEHRPAAWDIAKRKDERPLGADPRSGRSQKRCLLGHQSSNNSNNLKRGRSVFISDIGQISARVSSPFVVGGGGFNYIYCGHLTKHDVN